MARAAWIRICVLVFFFGSGTTGLVLEVIWARILGTVFGNTVYAASTVLTAYMLGLALGSITLGKLADQSRRPLLVYGVLEAAVGLYALLFPFLVTASLAFYGWFYRTLDPSFTFLNLVRFSLSLLLLLPPTFCMGGTLPMLGRFLGVRRTEPGQEVGYLYGINTIGAVAGCFLAGFVLLEALGVKASLFAAAFLDLAIGGLAFALGRKVPVPGDEKKRTGKRAKKAKQKRPKPETQPVPSRSYPLVLLAFGITGFCALGYEVLWTRILLFAVRTSVYSFATMLTVFLSGIGVGSYISARWIVRRMHRPLLWFGALEILVGLSALLTVPLLANLAVIDYQFSQHLAAEGSRSILLVRFADAFVVLFPPTLLMGIAFPVMITGCLRGGLPLGLRVGQLYAANTIGSVLGAFFAGFLLLPALGASVSIVSLVALNLTVGAVICWYFMEGSIKSRIAFAAPLAAVAVLSILFIPTDIFYSTINIFHSPSKITFLREHSTGTVAVHDLPNGERLLTVDGVDVAGLDPMLRTTQKLQGYIPLCIHPKPESVLQIGFGSGETARTGLEFGIENYTAVEICPAVFEAGKYFEHINAGSYKSPEIRKVIMDGKNFALLSDQKFDIVMNDSIYPGSSGSAALYTVDHFRNCRERLAEGGLFSCWVPLDLRPSEFEMVLKSFQKVFPHMSVWVATNYLNKHALFLGTLSKLNIDFARLKATLNRPHVAQDLKKIAIRNVYDFLDCHICDERAIRKFTADAPVNTDDRPRLEISCAVPLRWQSCLLGTVTLLAKNHSPVEPYLTGLPETGNRSAELKQRFKATGHILKAQVAQLAGQRHARREELAEALKANPGEVHVHTCQEELEREIRDLYGVYEQRPGLREIALRLARKLFMALRDEEAIPVYEKLIRSRPPPPDTAYVNLAEMYFRSGQLERAERTLTKCLGCWPGSAEAYDRLAGLCFKTGRRAEATDYIEKALNIEPENAFYKLHYRKITGDS